MVQLVMHTHDGRLRVYIHEDQTAEISDGKGALLSAGHPLYVIGERLAAMGIDSDDLIQD